MFSSIYSYSLIFFWVWGSKNETSDRSVTTFHPTGNENPNLLICWCGCGLNCVFLVTGELKIFFAVLNKKGGIKTTVSNSESLAVWIPLFTRKVYLISIFSSVVFHGVVVHNDTNWKRVNIWSPADFFISSQIYFSCLDLPDMCSAARRRPKPCDGWLCCSSHTWTQSSERLDILFEQRCRLNRQNCQQLKELKILKWREITAFFVFSVCQLHC